MKNNFQDRIDEYILGRMSDEEKAQFEAEVNQNESKKDQLEFTRNIKGAISSREDKLIRMKMMQRLYERKRCQAAKRTTGTDDCMCVPTLQCAKKKSLRRFLWLVSGISTVLVVGLFILTPFGDNLISTDFLSDKMLNNSNFFFGMDSTEIDKTIKYDAKHHDTIQISE